MLHNIFVTILACSVISIPKTIPMPVGTHYGIHIFVSKCCIDLWDMKGAITIHGKNIYIFQPFPVEIKRWICSYCTWPWKFPPDFINKPTCSVHYTFMPKVKASHIRRGKKITRDFKEKQPGDSVSRAVEFSGIKLQFRGRHRRERPLLDASHTSPQADLQAVDTAEQNEKWFLWKVSCHHPLGLSLLLSVTLHTPANLIHSK